MVSVSKEQQRKADGWRSGYRSVGKDEGDIRAFIVSIHTAFSFIAGLHFIVAFLFTAALPFVATLIALTALAGNLTTCRWRAFLTRIRTIRHNRIIVIPGARSTLGKRRHPSIIRNTISVELGEPQRKHSRRIHIETR